MRRKQKKEKSFWIAVSRDEYEWIEEMTDTAMEMAERCGTTVTNVRSSASKHKHGRNPHTRFMQIPLNDEDE